MVPGGVVVHEVNEPPTATGTTGGTVTADRDDEAVRIVAADAHGQRVLDALGDEASREILEATGERAMTARELSERRELALSTTYRKVDDLVGAGLLWERIRLLASGKRSTEYVRAVEDVVVQVDGEEGTVLRITLREAPDGDVPAWPGGEG